MYSAEFCIFQIMVFVCLLLFTGWYLHTVSLERMSECWCASSSVWQVASTHLYLSKQKNRKQFVSACSLRLQPVFYYTAVCTGLVCKLLYMFDWPWKFILFWHSDSASFWWHWHHAGLSVKPNWFFFISQSAIKPHHYQTAHSAYMHQ